MKGFPKKTKKNTMHNILTELTDLGYAVLEDIYTISSTSIILNEELVYRSLL